MKKIYFLTLALICAIAANAVNIPSGTKLYFAPNSNWLQASARFAAYYFGNDNAWVDGSEIKDGVYEFTTPSGTWTNVIFVRMNPEATANNWDNKWNQTSDLTYDGTNNLYTYASGSSVWDKGNGTWSVFAYPEKVYILGHLDGISAWKTNSGVTVDATEDGVYKATGVTVVDSSGGYGYFAFTDKLSSTSNDWDGLGARYGANESNAAVTLGSNMTVSICDNSWKLAAGTYDMVLSLVDKTLKVTETVPTSVEETLVDSAAVEYFNLQGVKVACPENGLFIKKQGNKVTKVIL